MNEIDVDRTPARGFGRAEGVTSTHYVLPVDVPVVVPVVADDGLPRLAVATGTGNVRLTESGSTLLARIDGQFLKAEARS